MRHCGVVGVVAGDILPRRGLSDLFPHPLRTSSALALCQVKVEEPREMKGRAVISGWDAGELY